MKSIVTPKDPQKAQNPGPVGRGQATRVPTHEGSMLYKPTKAGVQKGSNIIK
jgi:hypothetical protein